MYNMSIRDYLNVLLYIILFIISNILIFSSRKIKNIHYVLIFVFILVLIINNFLELN
jgi:hypothetical protein